MAHSGDCISPQAATVGRGVSFCKDDPESVPLAEKEVSTRSDTDIIKDYLGERNLFSEEPGLPINGAANAGGRSRQPFSDSSWLDKFLDERDKELDSVFEDSDDDEGVSLVSGKPADTCTGSTRVPKTHLVGRPSSIAAEEYIRRHKRTIETHFGIDYQDWSSILQQTSGPDGEDEATGTLGTAAVEGLSLEEILTDDFDSSSECSSDNDGLPTSWAHLGARQLSSVTAQRGVDNANAGRVKLAASSMKGKEVRCSLREGCSISQLVDGHTSQGKQEQAVSLEKGKGGLDRGRTLPDPGQPLIDAPDVSGLVSASADRALYAEIVRATERGASQERERMEALLSATATANQAALTRMGWSLAFADRHLEDAYRVSHIANGGDADYLCAVLRVWFSLLHLYMLGCQFRILKEVHWGWITISPPGKPILSTSLEWNIVGLALMLVFLCMRLGWRSWWNRNRLPLLSVYLGTLWALEVWYMLASHDAPGYRLVRLGSPSFFMTFMYNVPFLLHSQVRTLVLVAQLVALAVRRDFYSYPFVILFHVLSSVVAFFLDRRSRRAFLSKLPPRGVLTGRQDSLFEGGTGTANAGALKTGLGLRDGLGSQPTERADRDCRRDNGGTLGGCGLKVLGGGEDEAGPTSTVLEEQLRERLRQRRSSYGGFAGGFAGVGCVKTGPCCARMPQETQVE